MPREITPEDFSDDDLTRVFEGVTRLVWSAQTDLPEWVHREADAFAADPPRATPDELREHIGHAVTVARGWDDPDDRRTMLHSALKSFYLIKWLERLVGRNHGGRPDLSLAYRVSFTPAFTTNASIGIPPAKLNPEA